MVQSSLVSILIPCYNAEKWLAETLESALAQTWTNTEIILVDDGSTDGSLAIAKSFQSSQLKVVSQSNKGASAARNHAYQTAQGEYIQYLDADDLLHPDKIEKQVRLSQKIGTNYVISGEWARFYKSPSEATFTPELLWADMLPVNWLVTAWKNNLMMHPAAWLVPRSLAESAGNWNEKLSLDDDGEYFCRVVLASEGVRFCHDAKSYYRSGIQGSLSGHTSDRSYESSLLAIQLKTQYLLDVEDNQHNRQVCADCFQRFIYLAYPQVPHLIQQARLAIQRLGGSYLKPTGSPLFECLSTLIGWQFAKQIQKTIYHLGYAQWRKSLGSRKL